jgi:hypothetical protein
MSRYLPSLSTLITLGDLPESLGFLQNATNNIFDDVYFDHYQVIGSKYGEEKTYNLDVIFDKHLNFIIPGTGISLLLNPGDNNQNPIQTSFNVTLYYRLGILRFINNFSLSKFSFKKEDLIDLLLNICNIEPASVLQHISVHIKNLDKVTLGYIVYNEEELVAFFNSYYELTGTANELSYTVNSTFEDIEDGLASAGITTVNVIDDFGISTDYPNGEDNITDVYSRLNIERDTGPLVIPDLIDILNNNYELTGTPHEIIYTANPETSYDDVIRALNQADITLLNLIIDYIALDKTSFSNIEEVLVDFFVELKEDFSGTSLYGMFTPLMQASINNLNLALELPRSVLKPIDPATNKPFTDENIKSMLRFNVGSLNFSSATGFEFKEENSFIFNKSEIGNTGLILSFTNAKLDFSRTSNIPCLASM